VFQLWVVDQFENYRPSAAKAVMKTRHLRRACSRGFSGLLQIKATSNWPLPQEWSLAKSKVKVKVKSSGRGRPLHLFTLLLGLQIESQLLRLG
jgi:hypothetical protein